MLFSDYIVIPAGTSFTNPVIKRMILTKAVIHTVEFIFLPGNCYSAYIWVTRGLHQIYPTNPDGFLYGDNETVKGNVFHYIKNTPYEVEIKGCAPGATYDHIIGFRIWMQHPWQMNVFSDEYFMLTLEDSIGS